MTVTLELPDQLEAELSADAQRLGVPLSEYVVRLLAQARPVVNVRNGAELVRYWQSEGLIGTRSDITDSSSHARTIRAQAERRERA